MTSPEPIQQPGPAPHGLSRRAVLRGGAVAGTLVWVAPVVQAVSMSPAHAATTSAPRESAKQAQVSSGGALPRTGTEAAPVAAIGAGALALGAAAVVAARKLGQSTDETTGEA